MTGVTAIGHLIYGDQVVRALFPLTLLIIAGCSCDPDVLTRVCPDGIHQLTKDEDAFDIDGDGWSACEGDCNESDPETHPGAFEKCDNQDNDCDGSVDGAVVECWSGPPGVVIGGNSVCVHGTTTCASGAWGPCEGQVHPAVREACNGLDDDCDGNTDEVSAEFCGPPTDVGACQFGTPVCAGDETLCTNAVYPTAEDCNSADDDCDGEIDEGLERVCRTSCGVGAETCQDGQWVGCSAPIPVPEECNGLDDDCNGAADDGIECLCQWDPDPEKNQVAFCQSTPLTCGVGLSICQPDGQWGPCTFYANAPESCNGWDDDCDGIEDGMVEQCGDPLHAGIGVCVLGERTCTSGTWTDCIGAVDPTDEICNELDDDCDGETDEDLDPHEKVDIWFIIDGSGSMCPRVVALEQGITNYVAEFQGSEHRFGLGVFPGMGWPNPNSLVDVLIPMSDISTFLAGLATYNCNFGGIEPAWDAMGLSASPTLPIPIGWRAPMPISGTPDIDPGAWPYIVMIADEDPDQGVMTEQEVADEVSDCRVGACPLDCQNGTCVPRASARFETFVITDPGYFLLWDAPTFYEPERLIPIEPADPQRYTEVLRGIFRNVCR